MENLQGGGESYEEFYDKRNSPEIGGDLSEFFEENSERAESEESLDKIDSEGGKTLPLNFDSHPVNESDQDKLVKPGTELCSNYTSHQIAVFYAQFQRINIYTIFGY